MTPFMEICVSAARALLFVAAALGAVRLLRGPSAMNRLLALDFLSLVAIGLMTLEGFGADKSPLLAPAVGLALVSFVSTVAFGRLVERRHGEGRDE